MNGLRPRIGIRSMLLARTVWLLHKITEATERSRSVARTFLRTAIKPAPQSLAQRFSAGYGS